MALSLVLGRDVVAVEAKSAAPSFRLIMSWMRLKPSFSSTTRGVTFSIVPTVTSAMSEVSTPRSST